MSVQMHHGDNQDDIVANPVDQAVGESACAAPTRAFGNERPRLGVLQDTGDRSPYFRRESVAKPLAFVIVVGYRFTKFLPGWIEKSDSHGRACRSISLKTSSAGTDSIWPRS